MADIQRIRDTDRKTYIWDKCPECDRSIWKEPKGEFYHRLVCSKSNGIGYGEEGKAIGSRKEKL